MFTKIDNTHFKLIGENKKNIFPELEGKLYNLEIKKSFFGKDFIFSPLDRYNNTTVAKVGIFKDVYEYTKEFYNESRIKLRKEMGFLNKMSLILKGDPGTGKTHLACTVASELVRKNNGVGIVVNDIEDIKFDKLVDDVRINNPKRLIVFVLDELEKSNRYTLRDTDFLAFLDGAKSRENVIIIATVNTIEDFPKFLIKRPGRFEKIYNFVFNTEEVLNQLIGVLLPERYKNNKVILNELLTRAIAGKVATIDHLRFSILNYLTDLENGKMPKKIELAAPKIVKEVTIKQSAIQDIETEEDKKMTVLNILKKAFSPSLN